MARHGRAPRRAYVGIHYVHVVEGQTTTGTGTVAVGCDLDTILGQEGGDPGAHWQEAQLARAQAPAKLMVGQEQGVGPRRREVGDAGDVA